MRRVMAGLGLILLVAGAGRAEAGGVDGTCTAGNLGCDDDGQPRVGHSRRRKRGRVSVVPRSELRGDCAASRAGQDDCRPDDDGYDHGIG